MFAIRHKIVVIKKNKNRTLRGSRGLEMDEYALKMLALEVCSLMPEDSKDALAVLDLARGLVVSWLGKPGEIVEFPKDRAKAQ